jgi:hypothetical protein
MSNDLVTVASFADPIEANLAKNNLEAAGVRTFLANEESVDMLWHLGNAMGWIKVQVAHDNLGVARALLNKHKKPAASTRDEPVEDPPEAALSPNLAGSDEAEAGDEHEDENQEDEPEPSLTDREKDAERACRGAFVGLLFIPLQVYVFYLLLKVFVSQERLADRARRRALVAAAINLPVMIGICCFLRAMLSSS